MASATTFAAFGGGAIASVIGGGDPDGFSIYPLMDLALRFAWVPWACAALYGLGVFFGQRAMRARAALELRAPLVAWNAALAAFSLAGLCATAPTALAALAGSPSLGLCGALPFETGAAGRWVAAFMLSKVPELCDTAFLVLRKRPVSFLHAFHHATVLLYSWSAFALRSHLGLHFTTMNLAVHALMYLYYALAAAGFKPAWGVFVTRLQIAQMAAGVLLTAKAATLGCEHPISLAGAMLLYSAYLVLFVRFALERGPRGAKQQRED
jgi:hypothetical protein